MSDPEPQLARIQRWMQSVITHPGGVAEGVDSPQALEHLQVPLDELDRVIRPSKALSSDQRLEIYVDAYYLRLLECLSQEFAVTRVALGEELFGGLAFGYLQSYPSHSYTLGALGAAFPRYLEETQLHADEVPDGAPETWPEFIVELARFERAVHEVFDGPGCEQSSTLEPETLRALAADPGQIRLRAAPCLRLMPFRHAVHHYWTAVSAGAPPPSIVAEPAWLAIHRRHFVVEHAELELLECGVLSVLVEGATLGDTVAQIARQFAPTSKILDRFQAWFAAWAQRGYFVGIDAAPRPRE